jgi:hypothetical protein
MTTVILTPTTASPVNGAALNFSDNFYVVNVGNVGTGTPAEVAAAANKVYTVADFTGNYNTTDTAGNHGTGENIVFMGETSTGNLVMEYWATHAGNLPGTGADANSNHLVDASEFYDYDNPLVLVGVTASVINTHTFH